MQEKNGVPGERPAEASLDRKPNSHTAPGPGNEPGISGPQRGGSTATLPAFPRKCDILTICWSSIFGLIIIINLMS